MGLLILTLFSFFIWPVEQTGVVTSFEQRDSIILHEEDKNMGKRASSVGLVQKRKIDATANHVETWVHKIEQAPHNIYLLISFVMFTFFLSSSSILYSLFLFLVTVCVFCRRVKPRRGACRADQSGPPPPFFFVVNSRAITYINQSWAIRSTALSYNYKR